MSLNGVRGASHPQLDSGPLGCARIYPVKFGCSRLGESSGWVGGSSAVFGFPWPGSVGARLDSAVLGAARRCFVGTRLGSVALGSVGARLSSASLVSARCRFGCARLLPPPSPGAAAWLFGKCSPYPGAGERRRRRGEDFGKGRGTRETGAGKRSGCGWGNEVQKK